MPGGITATELDCVIGEETVALMVTPLEKVIWDEAFLDAFTDDAVAVVASIDAAVTFFKLNDGEINENTEEVTSIVVKDEVKERSTMNGSCTT